MKTGEIWECVNPITMIIGDSEKPGFNTQHVSIGEKVKILKLNKDNNFFTVIIVKRLDKTDIDVHIPDKLFIDSFVKDYHASK